MAVAEQDRRHAGAMVCPDPSVHEEAQKERRLQQQAAGAALHATHSDGEHGVSILDEDGKLSSAGAAMSLKYAQPQDLPSFPSVGIDTAMSAGAAATLAHSNPKSVEWWKPEMSANAGKAAMLAKDYKMDPLWHPEASTAGSKAAILAHKGPGREWWQAQPSKEGHSAAEIAVRNKKPSPEVYRIPEDGRQKALLAATLSVKGRKRSDSTPEPAELYPDASRSGYNAYNAATVADANKYAKALEASRVTHLGQHVTPQMFTEHPPIAWEVEDQKHDDSLRASAIAMAKKMYEMQEVDDEGNITIKGGQTAATTANNRASLAQDTNLRTQALQYISLQEAAQRLAAERLAKIQQPDEAAAFQSYYGYPPAKARSRLSIRKSNRGRASSEGGTQRRSRLDYDSDDETQARRIRTRQSQFNDQLAAVDKKRDADRKALLAAAEKRVQAKMHALDERVFNDTGKMSPQMVEEWDAKARARAVANSEARMQHHGKVDIGGGRYLDQSEINAIAQARIQPTLDQINEKAEKQRARDEELRLEAEERKRTAQIEKEREAEMKAEQKRAKSKEKADQQIKKHEEKEAARKEKDAQKAKREEEKEMIRRKKEAEKAKEDEEKRLAAEQKRKSREAHELEGDTSPTPVLAPTTAAAAPLDAEADAALHAGSDFETEEARPSSTADADIVAHRGTHVGSSASEPATADLHHPSAAEHSDEAGIDGDEPSSPHSPTKRGFRSVLSKFKPTRTKDKSSAGAFSTTLGKSHDKRKGEAEEQDRSFIGGTALANSTSRSSSGLPKRNAPESSPSISSLDDSDRELEEQHSRGRSASRDAVSAISDDDDDDEFEEARDTILPPPQPVFASIKSASPTRESRFKEDV